MELSTRARSCSSKTSPSWNNQSQNTSRTKAARTRWKKTPKKKIRRKRTGKISQNRTNVKSKMKVEKKLITIIANRSKTSSQTGKEKNRSLIRTPRIYYSGVTTRP